MRLRGGILFISIFSLVIGLIIGVSKSGFWGLLNHVLQYHFLILCGSFFGTLITLERAVTIKNRNFHFLPIINGSSILFYLMDMPGVGTLTLILGGIIVTGMYVYFFIQHLDKIHFIFVISGNCYLMAAVFYYYAEWNLSIRYFELFFLLTISAERLELARFINISELKKAFLVVLLLLSCFVINIEWLYGWIIILISLWFIFYDIAGINIRSKDPHRFRGWALMSGYYWLLVHGLSFIFSDKMSYDIRIHSFFLGFVMNMVFAHISIILPAVLKIQFSVPSKFYYTVWGIFQLILLIRFVSSMILSELFPLIAFLNALVILVFFVINGKYIFLCKKQ